MTVSALRAGDGVDGGDGLRGRVGADQVLELVDPAEDHGERDRLEDGEGDRLEFQRSQGADENDGAHDRAALQPDAELPQQHAVREQQQRERQHSAVRRPFVRHGVEREGEGSDREQAHTETRDRLGHEHGRQSESLRLRGHHGAQAHPQHPG
ncbi:hypothetical protein PQI51_12190 [Microbacterium esteraromaticum]|uniref:hypothetical protein n=1 Tax=Microbacterium esteraromaticum TaxID=57043 RepID=UPI0030982CFB